MITVVLMMMKGLPLSRMILLITKSIMIRAIIKIIKSLRAH